MTRDEIPALVPADIAAALRAAGEALLTVAAFVPDVTDSDALARLDALRRDLADHVRRGRVLVGAYRVAPQEVPDAR